MSAGVWIVLGVVLMAAALAWPAQPVAPAELYVAPYGSDAATGTLDDPLRTIGEAASRAGPGTRVSVAPGTYAEAVQTSVSGTSSARVQFVSETRWGARIAPEDGYRAWMNWGDYVDIVGFEVTAPQAHVGIQNNGSHVRTMYNHVHTVASHVTDDGCDPDGGSGINDANYDATDNEMRANLVHDIGTVRPRARRSCWVVHGLYQSTAHSRVVDNIAYRNESFGITLWHAATGNVVNGNLAFNNGVGGIGVGAGDAPGGVVGDNYLVSNNMVLHNPVFGIRASGSLGDNNRYVSNLLYRNGTAFSQVDSGVEGTIFADPQLANYQPDGFADDGDFHPRRTSPAVDAGTSRGDVEGALDYDGAPRLQGRARDIGPYESASLEISHGLSQPGDVAR
jgi:parallel beta-helix repeat protein